MIECETFIAIDAEPTRRTIHVDEGACRWLLVEESIVIVLS